MEPLNSRKPLTLALQVLVCSMNQYKSSWVISASVHRLRSPCGLARYEESLRFTDGHLNWRRIWVTTSFIPKFTATQMRSPRCESTREFSSIRWKAIALRWRNLQGRPALPLITRKAPGNGAERQWHAAVADSARQNATTLCRRKRLMRCFVA
jgi:hypothetical protein